MLSLQIVLKLIKPPCFEGINGNLPDICGDIRLRGFPCFLLAEDPELNAPIGSSLLFGHFPKCLRYSVSIAENVSNPFWAFPKESPIPFKFYSNGLQELLGSFPNMFQHRFGRFIYISLESGCFCLLRLKIRCTTEKFQTHQRLFSQL